MAEEDKFCLKWNDFQDNIVRAHSDLRNDKDFYDVSLVCGGETFKAHRVILAACSPAFRDMIRWEVQEQEGGGLTVPQGVPPPPPGALPAWGEERRRGGAAGLHVPRGGQPARGRLGRLPVHGGGPAGARPRHGGGAGAGGKEQVSNTTHQLITDPRRVSGSNMATALDDDVASLLAGLDGDGPAQPPPAKKVKQERHEAGKQLAR